MDDESLKQRVLHLRQVEGLSGRQIAHMLGISRKRVQRILEGSHCARALPKISVLDEYVHLIVHWYKEYPRLKAKQVYERLQSYGYQGSYASVVRLSRKYRKRKKAVYHPLTFVPGEEAQVDWFFFNHPQLGQLCGFVYVLSYSRYAWGMFYPKTSFEFFLNGHLQCFAHLQGLAHRHRYDNLKSVVLSRHPQIKYNPQFLDFSRFFGFSIYACNPYKGNEKGRVERVIRDIRVFLYAEEFESLADLNQKFHAWLSKRNNTVHRSTQKTPKDLLVQERLIQLPKNLYPPRRIIPAVSSKTALVEFETNKYSVPSPWASLAVEVIAYPDKVEIAIKGKTVAVHKRCFNKRQTIQNPLHAEKLLKITPQFKMQRICELMTNMDKSFKDFILAQEDEGQRIQTAYTLFQLMKTHSRAMIISAVRELNAMRCFKIKSLYSLLNLPASKDSDPLWPQKTQLLNLDYPKRSLTDYDPDSNSMEPA
jgi:transposase